MMFKKFKLWPLSGILVFTGILFLLAFQYIGSAIDQDGFLHEPFALIPLAWLFIILGVVIGIMATIRAGIRYFSGTRKK